MRIPMLLAVTICVLCGSSYSFKLPLRHKRDTADDLDLYKTLVQVKKLLDREKKIRELIRAIAEDDPTLLPVSQQTQTQQENSRELVKDNNVYLYQTPQEINRELPQENNAYQYDDRSTDKEISAKAITQDGHNIQSNRNDKFADRENKIRELIKALTEDNPNLLPNSKTLNNQESNGQKDQRRENDDGPPIWPIKREDQKNVNKEDNGDGPPDIWPLKKQAPNEERGGPGPIPWIRAPNGNTESDNHMMRDQTNLIEEGNTEVKEHVEAVNTKATSQDGGQDFAHIERLMESLLDALKKRQDS